MQNLHTITAEVTDRKTNAIIESGFVEFFKMRHLNVLKRDVPSFRSPLLIHISFSGL